MPSNDRTKNGSKINKIKPFPRCQENGSARWGPNNSRYSSTPPAAHPIAALYNNRSKKSLTPMHQLAGSAGQSYDLHTWYFARAKIDDIHANPRLLIVPFVSHFLVSFAIRESLCECSLLSLPSVPSYAPSLGDMDLFRARPFCQQDAKC